MKYLHTLALVSALLSLSLLPAWAATVTPATDETMSTQKAALGYPSKKLLPSQSHAMVTVYPAGTTSSSRGGDTVSLTSSDFCGTGTNAIVCTGTDGKISSSVIPTSTSQIRSTGGLVWQNTVTNTGTATGTHTVTATSTSVASEPTVKAVSPFIIDGVTSDLTCGQLSDDQFTVGCALGSSAPSFNSAIWKYNTFGAAFGARGPSTSVVGGSVNGGMVFDDTASASVVPLVGPNLTSEGHAIADVAKTDTISASGGDYAFSYRTGTNTTTDTSTGTGTSCPFGRSCTMVRTSTTTATATVTNSVNGHAISINPVLNSADVGALPTSAIPTSAPGWLHDNGGGARVWSYPTYSDVGAPPTSRTVCGHALSSDVTCTYADVGATPDNLSITANNTPAAVTNDNRGRVTGYQSITPAWIGAIPVSHVFSGGAAGPPSDVVTSSASWTTVATNVVVFPAATSTVVINGTVEFITAQGNLCYAALFVGGVQVVGSEKKMSGPSGTGGNPGGCGANCGYNVVATTGRYAPGAGTFAVELKVRAGGSGSSCYVLSSNYAASFTFTVGPS